MLLAHLLFASTATATCLHGLSRFKKRAEAGAEGEVEVSNFGYGPLDGPFNWITLNPVENVACKSGSNQSPINIDESISAALHKPVLDIPAQAVEFENLGTTIEIVLNGTTTLAGSAYQLVQFHMHTPSEHYIAGEYYPLEVHMVHQRIDDPTQIAVVALLFQVSSGESASIIRSLSSSIPAITSPGTKTAIPAGIDFSDVLSKISTSKVLQYTGSLTTPPCAEGVLFTIVHDPLEISVADYNAIKSVIKFNARYMQNTLGAVNMLEVGSLAGTAAAVQPPVEAPAPATNATVNSTKAVEPAAHMSIGQRFTVTELQGQATQIPAIVVARKRRY